MRVALHLKRAFDLGELVLRVDGRAVKVAEDTGIRTVPDREENKVGCYGTDEPDHFEEITVPEDD